MLSHYKRSTCQNNCDETSMQALISLPSQFCFKHKTVSSNVHQSYSKSYLSFFKKFKKILISILFIYCANQKCSANATPSPKAIDLLMASRLDVYEPNYCNQSDLISSAGLLRAPLGQFLGFPCSNEFFHCRWQSDGYRTYKKNCRLGK